MPNVDKYVIRRREIDHTGQCKSTGGYLQRPGVGFFFRTGTGETLNQQLL